MAGSSTTCGGRAPGPALLILVNVPFAATGGVLALLARGLPFSISAAVGFTALFGVAVLNGLVLVSQIRALGAEAQRPLVLPTVYAWFMERAGATSTTCAISPRLARKPAQPVRLPSGGPLRARASG